LKEPGKSWGSYAPLTRLKAEGNFTLFLFQSWNHPAQTLTGFETLNFFRWMYQREATPLLRILFLLAGRWNFRPVRSFAKMPRKEKNLNFIGFFYAKLA